MPCNGSPKLDTAFRLWFLKCQIDGIITFPDLLASPLPVQSRCLCCKACCLLLLDYLSSRTLRAFSAELLPSQWAPSLYWSCSVRDAGLYMWTSCGSCLPFLQSVKITLSSSTTSSSVTTLHNLVSPLRLLTAHPCLSVQILKEMLNCMAPVGLPEGCH